ncbi:hypothetical protein J5N97_029299 [Dioscorea zingiberensis]|uniref:C3H1-type domain-containing protein n=1 Tax=Dioscorea zingiberensis TaxID=325984 RepID=A0A9D5C028_9LILI|nr:hypothetical protein J5N97_029299 [Dioscorea zingiberensis]
MAGKKQRKRVSWAPDLSLRQIRLFLSEDAPSQFRYGGQDHLQAKSSWLWHATEMGSDDSLPPGFEIPPQAPKKSKIDTSQIPLIKWQCALKLKLNPEWLVVAGEESEEVTTQTQRLRGVLEAIYPRPSSIPPDPTVLSGVEGSLYDDLDIPLIPITATEDEDASESTDTAVPVDTSSRLQSVDVPKSWPEESAPAMLPDYRFPTEQSRSNSAPAIQDFPHVERPTMGAIPVAEPDVMAAASVAFTAIMRSSEAGSNVDPDLLIKIFSNPTLLETLTSEYGLPKQIAPPVATSSAPPPPNQISVTSLPLPQTGQLYPVTNVIRPPVVNPQAPPAIQFNTSNPLPTAPPPMKDINYYKSLIQQHGEDRQEAPALNTMQFGNNRDYPQNIMAVNGMELSAHGSKQRDTKPKILKPCIYFNSPRGCRHGANCSYQHDVAYPAHIEQQKNKRIKLDSAVNGRL